MRASLEDETCNESSDEEESLLSYQGHSVSAIVYESVSLIIDTLYQLSFRIRNSTTQTRFPKPGSSSQANEEIWVNPEEDRRLEDKIPDVSGINHQRTLPSQGSFKQIDKNEVPQNEFDDNEFDDNEFDDNEFDDGDFDDNAFDDNAFNDNAFDDNAFDDDKIDNNLKSWDIASKLSFTPPRETLQKDPRRFESSPQEVNKSTKGGRDKETLDYPYGGLKSDNALLCQDGSSSNTPVSVIGQPSSSVSNSNTLLVKTYPYDNAESVSFYVVIDELEPNYDAQRAQHGTHGFWSPPTIRTGYTTRSSSLFHWRGGTMTYIAAHEITHHLLGQIHSAATVFTSHPDTPHLLVVPFDARRRDVDEYPGAWRPLTFRHVRIVDTQGTYSAVSANGDRQYIATRGSSRWMPQLLPRVYDNQSRSTRTQAGLIGSIPLLIALAAFSAPISFLQAVLTNCVRPQRWLPHQYQYPAGRKLQKSVAIPI